jgi:hypothetical protein
MEGGSMAIEQERIPDFIVRLRDERDELQSKLEKLRTFLANPKSTEIPVAELARLMRQSKLMDLYLDVLDERLNAYRARG